jgi:hypothetical protein
VDVEALDPHKYSLADFSLLYNASGVVQSCVFGCELWTMESYLSTYGNRLGGWSTEDLSSLTVGFTRPEYS